MSQVLSPDVLYKLDVNSRIKLAGFPRFPELKKALKEIGGEILAYVVQNHTSNEMFAEIFHGSEYKIPYGSNMDHMCAIVAIILSAAYRFNRNIVGSLINDNGDSIECDRFVYNNLELFTAIKHAFNLDKMHFMYFSQVAKLSLYLGFNCVIFSEADYSPMRIYTLRKNPPQNTIFIYFDGVHYKPILTPIHKTKVMYRIIREYTCKVSSKVEYDDGDATVGIALDEIAKENSKVDDTRYVREYIAKRLTSQNEKHNVNMRCETPKPSVPVPPKPSVFHRTTKKPVRRRPVKISTNVNAPLTERDILRNEDTFKCLVGHFKKLYFISRNGKPLLRKCYFEELRRYLSNDESTFDNLIKTTGFVKDSKRLEEFLVANHDFYMNKISGINSVLFP